MNALKRIFPLIAFLCLVFSFIQAQNPAKGFKYLEKDEFDKAEETFLKILEKEPENAGALFGMSIFHLKKNKEVTHSQAALTYLEKAESAFGALEAKDQEKMAEFGLTPTALEAQRDELEALFFERAKEANQLEDIQGYIDQFPNSKLMKDAVVIRNELAYKRVWERCAKEGKSAGLFEEFVKTYPNAKQVVMAEFEIAKITNTPEGFEAFIEKYPTSEFVQEAKEGAHQAAFEQAQEAGTEAAFVTFIRKYPTAKQYSKAVQLRDAAAFEAAQNASPSQRVKALTEFLNKYPNASQAPEAKKSRDELGFQQASIAHTIEAYREYLTKYPGTAQGVEAAYRIADLYHTPGALQTFVENNPGSAFEKQAETSIQALENPKEQLDVTLGSYPANSPFIYATKGSYHIFAHQPDAPDYLNYAIQITKTGDVLQTQNLKTRAFNEGYMFDMPIASYADRPDSRGNLNQLYLLRQYESRFDKEMGQLESPYYLRVNYYDLFKPAKSNAELIRKYQISRPKGEARLNGTPAYHSPKANKLGMRHLEIDDQSFLEVGLLDGKDLGMIPYSRIYTESDSGWYDASKSVQVVTVRPGEQTYTLKNLVRLDQNHVLIHFQDEGTPDDAAFKPITASAIRSGYKHNATGTDLSSGKKLFVMDKEWYGLDRTKPVAGKIGAGESLYFLPEYMTCANKSKFITNTFLVMEIGTRKIVGRSTLYGEGVKVYPDDAGGFFAVYGQGPAVIRFGQNGSMIFVTAPEKCDTGVETPMLTVAGRYFYLGGATSAEGAKIPVIRIYELDSGKYIRDDQIKEASTGATITALTSEGISIVFLTGGDGKLSFHKRKY